MAIGWRNLILVFILSSASVLDAEDDEIERINLDFTVYSLGSTFEGIYFQSTGEDPVELEFSALLRSQKYIYKGNNPIVFFRISNSEDGKELHIPIATLVVPSGLKTGLILFSERSTPSGIRIDLNVLDDSLSAFPRDSLLFYNSTGVNLFGKIGDKKLNLPIGPSPVFSLNKYFNKDGLLPVAFAVVLNDQSRLVYSHTLSFNPNVRTLFILLPPKRSGSLRVQTKILEDFPAGDGQNLSISSMGSDTEY